jgi:hypothetical protein
LKLESDEVLSTYAFKFNLRRYNTEEEEQQQEESDGGGDSDQSGAGAYTRPLFSST